MKIKIINGTYGHRPDGALHPHPVAAGDICDVQEAEAMRLVKLGVATIVHGVAPAAAATASAVPDCNGPSVIACAKGSAFEEDGVLDVVDGHFTAESLSRMNRTDLNSLAEDFELDVSGCKTKADVVAALVKVQIDPPQPDDGEAPPQLDAEAPVA